MPDAAPWPGPDPDEMVISDSRPYTGIVGKQETGARRVADLLREPRPPIQWAIEGRLPVGGTGIATSAPKVGKTQTFMALTLAVARGREWLGSTVAQGPALYAIFEGSDAMNLDRFERFGIRDDDDLFYAFRPPMEDPAEWLFGEIGRTGARLAVIDTLFRFLREGDPSDYGDATKATDKLIGMAAQTGCAIISLHHNRKSGGEGGEEILGSQSLFGSVDCHWSISRNGDRRTIGTTQRYGLDMPATEVRIDPATGWPTLGDKQSEVRAEAVRVDVLAVLTGEPLTVEEIAERAGRRAAECRRVLWELTETAFAVVTGDGKRGDPRRWRAAHP